MTAVRVRTEALCYAGGVSAVDGVTEARHDWVHLMRQVVMVVWPHNTKQVRLATLLMVIIENRDYLHYMVTID